MIRTSSKKTSQRKLRSNFQRTTSFRNESMERNELALLRGLSNNQGENNCFLNVTIQALWHLRPFRLLFQQHLRNNQQLKGNEGGLLDTLCTLFIHFEFTEASVLPPTELRIALSYLSKEFELGKFADANEAFQAILEQIHKESINQCDSESIFNSEVMVGIADKLHGSTVKALYRQQRKCLSHQVFGGLFMRRRRCTFCYGTDSPIVKEQYFFHVNATELLNIARELVTECLEPESLQGAKLTPVVSHGSFEFSGSAGIHLSETARSNSVGSFGEIYSDFTAPARTPIGSRDRFDCSPGTTRVFSQITDDSLPSVDGNYKSTPIASHGDRVLVTPYSLADYYGQRSLNKGSEKCIPLFASSRFRTHGRFGHLLRHSFQSIGGQCPAAAHASSDNMCPGMAKSIIKCLQLPRVLAMSIGWASPHEPQQRIKDFLSLIDLNLKVEDLFGRKNKSQPTVTKFSAKKQRVNENSMNTDVGSNELNVSDGGATARTPETIESNFLACGLFTSMPVASTEEKGPMMRFFSNLFSTSDTNLNRSSIMSSSNTTHRADDTINDSVDDDLTFEKKSRQMKIYRLRGMICYYGLHYISIFDPDVPDEMNDNQNTLRQQRRKKEDFWIFDDQNIRRVGDWQQVMRLCELSNYQPVQLLYELQSKAF